MVNRFCGLVMSTAVLGALLTQVYIPNPEWHVYFVASMTFAAWLLVDAVVRRASIGSMVAYALFTLILAPLSVARWYACRPLLPGEWRKGGMDANFFTAFGITTLVFTGISAAANFVNFGPDRGFELIINSGFAVAGTAIVMGLVVRQDRLYEKGPAPQPDNAKD
jgi:hypothetical protein